MDAFVAAQAFQRCEDFAALATSQDHLVVVHELDKVGPLGGGGGVFGGVLAEDFLQRL